jgi:hypothetical protein
VLRKMSLAVAIIAAFATIPAFATITSTPLGTGLTVVPSATTNGTPAGVLIASNSMAGTGVGAGLTLNEAVYQVGSTFDFYYQLVLGTKPIVGLSSENFLGFSTSVGVDNITSSANLFANFVQPTAGDPTKVNKDVLGDVSWSYALGAGKNSAVLLISTDAPNWDSFGSEQVNFTKGSFSFNGTFEPAVAAPEPGFYGVVGIGLAGLWMGFRRRSKQQKVS